MPPDGRKDRNPSGQVRAIVRPNRPVNFNLGKIYLVAWRVCPTTLARRDQSTFPLTSGHQSSYAREAGTMNGLWEHETHDERAVAQDIVSLPLVVGRTAVCGIWGILSRTRGLRCARNQLEKPSAENCRYPLSILRAFPRPF